MNRESSYFCKVNDPGFVEPRFVLRLNNLAENQEGLARAIAQKTIEEFGEQPLDLIGINFTGNILAAFGHIGRLGYGLGGNNLVCHVKSSLWPREFKGVEGESSGATPLLFDNSVRSGKTLDRAMKQLRKEDLYPEYFMKMIDYQDERERRAQALLGNYGMRCLSVFTANQLTDALWLDEAIAMETDT